MAAPVRKIIVNAKKRGDMLDQDGSAILFWRRLQIADFSAAGTTNNVDLTGFPGGLLVAGAFAYLVADFAGGGGATATISLGTTGDVTKYIAATDVFTGQAPKAIVGKTIVPGTFLNTTTPTASGTIRATLVTDINSNLFTTGKVDIYVQLRAASIRNS